MKKYSYKARDKEGNPIKGIVEAVDKPAAAKVLRQKGEIVSSISFAQANPLTLFKIFKNRVTKTDVASFTRQLSTMINAGLTITKGLAILKNQSREAMQPIVDQILADIEGGLSLSAAFAKHPKIFSTTYIALIKSGEAGGVLDKVLKNLADNLEKEQAFRSKVKNALIYPVIIVVGMGIVGTIMMIFVIPRLTDLYSEFDAELPLATRILIGFSSILTSFWYIALILIVVGIVSFTQYRRTPKGRRKVDAFLFKIPISGPLSQQIAMVDLTRTMAMMIAAGVSIIETLNVVSAVVKNSIISDALDDAADQIEKGFPVAYSFARHPEAFPYILSQMIAVGEETGKVDDVLLKLSNIFEAESEDKVKNLTTAIEPLVMVLLGLGVGFLVIAVILPIYNLTSQF